jgi:hypothetical protein
MKKFRNRLDGLEREPNPYGKVVPKERRLSQHVSSALSTPIEKLATRKKIIVGLDYGTTYSGEYFYCDLKDSRLTR